MTGPGVSRPIGRAGRFAPVTGPGGLRLAAGLNRVVPRFERPWPFRLGEFLFSPGGFFSGPCGRGRGFPALRAGRNGSQRWLVHCTPHFLFLFPNKKRKRAVHGPKEKNKGTRLRGRAGSASGSRHIFCPRRGAGGGLSCEESSAVLFLLPHCRPYFRTASTASSFGSVVKPGSLRGTKDSPIQPQPVRRNRPHKRQRKEESSRFIDRQNPR